MDVWPCQGNAGMSCLGDRKAMAAVTENSAVSSAPVSMEEGIWSRDRVCASVGQLNFVRKASTLGGGERADRGGQQPRPTSRGAFISAVLPPPVSCLLSLSVGPVPPSCFQGCFLRFVSGAH